MRSRHPAFHRFAALSGVLFMGDLGSACSRPSAESKAPPPPEAPPIAVKLVTAETINVPRVLTLSGTLIGAEQARVAAGAAGKVIVTYVERGSVVKKGSVLARL